jgi:hypothetical protein
MTYAFRIRVIRAYTTTLSISSSSIELPALEGDHPVELSSSPGNNSIRDSEQVAVIGRGFNSEQEAWETGMQYLKVLKRTFAHLKIGVDYGNYAPKSGITEYGRNVLRQNPDDVILDDVHGLMVFPDDVMPKFVRMNPITAIGGKSERIFLMTLSKGLKTVADIEEREELSLELYNLSFFHNNPYTQFLLRVMAFEALIQTLKRSEIALKFVDNIIIMTENEQSLDPGEKDSLLGSLQWLRYESISRAGKNLADRELGERTYNGESPGKFFAECYNIRSKMVHGENLPGREEMGTLSSEMSRFMSDMLSGPLKDM